MSNPLAAAAAQLHTVLDFLRFAITQASTHTLFYGHGTDNAYSEMRSLITGTLRLPFDCDPLLLQGRLTSVEKNQLVSQLTRRFEDRVPVPYLINEAYFCELPFYVDERVLIPRSPIGELIQQQFSPWVVADEVTRILDLCTGSGCIAIACCYSFPDAFVDAVELSEDALAVARINAQRHEVEDNLTLIASDLWQQVPHTLYDIIVSNPPYVSDEEMQTLPREFLHEPDGALRAENNGLAIIDSILSKAYDYLAPQGVLVVEVGNSEEAVMEAYPELPFTWLDFEQGGQGVFLLTREDLAAYRNKKDER